jgi:acetylornithine deacetylase/succinyl-diaminopimelate desuccinylase-like protein
MSRPYRVTLVSVMALMCLAAPTTAASPDWKKLDDEVLKHYQTIVRFDTADPPGNEKPLSDYLVNTLKSAGIDVQTFAMEAHRPNVVARLKGSGKKKPLLLMAHQDVVNVDLAKWKFPPFSATRDGGYIYGRGTIDDKDNVTASLMAMLLMKRQNVPLDRDVIFLAEAGEEGNTQLGIEFMVDKHFDAIDSEYCIAEGAEVMRVDGKVKYAGVQTMEKIPRAIAVTAKGVAGHGSRPLRTNPIAHLSSAMAAIANYQAPIKLNETTTAYFERLAAISPPADAARYRAVLKPGTKEAAEAFEYLLEHEPFHASVLHTSVSPNIIEGGYRINVIPSEAKGLLDVRVLPNEDPQLTLDALRKVVNDPAMTVDWAPRNTRPGITARLDTEAFKVIEATFKEHYQTTVLPVMSTGATDMAYLRAKGVQCYGVGAAIDEEDGPKGFGMHSDQERLIEAELYRFVHFFYDAVVKLAQAK